ncbi:hypothetical protein FQN57_002521 [Myotisia sp. PD_48]|nr:hypothetical protein FQN57_002521 [Myotisia sp. PD_48]
MAASFSPNPSFHLCPDFNIAPPPTGHLKLGSVLSSLNIRGVLRPLNHGDTVMVPESQLQPPHEPMKKTGFSRSLKELRGLEGSIWAKIFGWEGLGNIFTGLRKRENDETLTVESLFIRYFIPTADYLKQALEADGHFILKLTTDNGDCLEEWLPKQKNLASEEGVISSKAASCDLKFSESIQLLQSREELKHAENLRKLHAKFTDSVAYLGVFAGSASLDQRLKNRPEYKALVLLALNMLEMNLISSKDE